MKARDVMTTQVATVRAETPVQEAAALMLEKEISGLPVVDARGLLCGMVSEGDLMRRVEAGTDQHRRPWWLRMLSNEDDDAREYVRSHGATVGDVMSHPVHAVGPDMELGEVAFLLEKKRIKRVPVADNGKVLGLVSRADLLRALAAAPPIHPEVNVDDRTIRDNLLKHLDEQSWAGGAVNVIVSEGVVSLWGLYDSEKQHEAYLVAARNAPGAKSVEDHLSRSMNT